MRWLRLIIGASWTSVKFRCDFDIQWKAPQKSRDLIASAIKAQTTRR